jgi:peptide deformylase
MKKEDIIALPNARLRQKSQKVTVFDASIKKLIKGMTDATLDWEASRPHEIGAALAAVQVDRLTRAIIVRSDLESKESREFTALINPKIIKHEGDIVFDHEGCLSVKDIYGLVPRYSKVRVKALDVDGNEIRIRAEGFLARVLQHEVDHTNGLLFIDHIKHERDAFFTLDETGELKKLDYEQYIKNSDFLW